MIFILKEEVTPQPTSKRGRKSKGADTAVSTPREASPDDEMPSVSQVCEQFGLNDVDLEYSEADYTNITTMKLFQQTYRQRVQEPIFNYCWVCYSM